MLLFTAYVLQWLGELVSAKAYAFDNHKKALFPQFVNMNDLKVSCLEYLKFEKRDCNDVNEIT